MDIIVLLDDRGRALHMPGSLHAAWPSSSGSRLPGPLTLCGKPPAAMEVLGPRAFGPDDPVYPPNLEGLGEGRAAGCPVCAQRATVIGPP
ncbi:hypothetical protein ACU686_12090 [Yinghuangia aomiensis]